jgi:hypothetical protein
MTNQEKAAWKRQARLVYKFGESRDFLRDEPKAIAKMQDLESTLEALETKMTDGQRQELADWASENGLYGILGTC